MNLTLLEGDSLEKLKELDDNSVDAVVCDPPYGLKFMAKKWDYDVPSVDLWREVFRVLKPGGHLLSFGGTRTYHRMVVAIEDAGFEIRDQIQWLYGSGFPKSLSIDKAIDSQERERWLKISKAIDNLNQSVIVDQWLESLKAAQSAEISFQKNETETGMNTQKSDFVLVSVRPLASLEKSQLNAIIAELKSSARRPIFEVQSTVPENAAAITTQLPENANLAESRSEDQSLKQSTINFSVLCDVRALLNENTTVKIRAAEALKTYIGKSKSSKKADTDALCADLIEALKLIILSQSKTFLSLDMKSQMDFVSATTVTITRSTAEDLISFTASTLKKEAIDKAAGAEREVVGYDASKARPNKQNFAKVTSSAATTENLGVKDNGATITAPATEDAKRWQGWGTALKPANEPICLARKPLEKGLTVAQNVLKYGTGGLNIDGCRVGYGEGESAKDLARSSQGFTAKSETFHNSDKYETSCEAGHNQGRWPANAILDEEAAKALDEQSGTLRARGNKTAKDHGGKYNATSYEFGGLESGWAGDSGGASRFFLVVKRDDLDITPACGAPLKFVYCAKASKAERNAGLEGMPKKKRSGNFKEFPQGGITAGKTKEQHGSNQQNFHPTVKPIKLMQYLCRLITPPGGVVLDPFMGSGSTGVAALKEGFGFIGIELSAEYFEIAKARLKYTHSKCKTEKYQQLEFQEAK